METGQTETWIVCPLPPEQTLFNSPLMNVGHGVLLLLLLFPDDAPPGFSAAARMLGSSAWNWPATLSYSLYLIHPIVMYWLYQYVFPAG